MTKWYNADVLISQHYKIAITSLPPGTDETAVIRMLTSRGMKESDGVCVEMADSNLDMLVEKAHAKKNPKKKLSYSVSFRSEAEMLAAIEML